MRFIERAIGRLRENSHVRKEAKRQEQLREWQDTNQKIRQFENAVHAVFDSNDDTNIFIVDDLQLARLKLKKRRLEEQMYGGIPQPKEAREL